MIFSHVLYATIINTFALFESADNIDTNKSRIYLNTVSVIHLKALCASIGGRLYLKFQHLYNYHLIDV